MDNYCAEYNGQNLRYGVEGQELLINTADLCALLRIERCIADVVDLAAAVHLARAHDVNVERWLLTTFEEYAPAELEGSLAWLHDEIRTQLEPE